MLEIIIVDDKADRNRETPSIQKKKASPVRNTIAVILS